MSASPVPAIAARIPRRRPPKLMHVLKVRHGHKNIINTREVIHVTIIFCDRMGQCMISARRPGRITTWTLR